MTKTRNPPSRLRSLPPEIESEILGHLEVTTSGATPRSTVVQASLRRTLDSGGDRVAAEYPRLDIGGSDPRAAYGLLYAVERGQDRVLQRQQVMEVASAYSQGVASLILLPSMLASTLVTASGYAASLAAGVGASLVTAPLGLISPVIPLVVSTATGAAGVLPSATADLAVAMPAAMASLVVATAGDAIADRLPPPPRRLRPG